MKMYRAMEEKYIPVGYDPYKKMFAIAAIYCVPNKTIEVILFQYHDSIFIYYEPSDISRLTYLCENLDDIVDLFISHNPNCFNAIFYNKEEFTNIKQLDFKKDFTLLSLSEGKDLTINYVKNNFKIDDETGEIL